MITKTIAWDSGSGVITLTYSGVGNAPISVKSDANEAFADRSQTVRLVTTAGSPQRAVSLLVNQKGKTYPIGTSFSYSYTSSVQQVALPAGRYKLQCWSAQGGTNFGTGSKGGYSEGILTLAETTTLYLFVGGQGSPSGNGGWNGGGGTTGFTSYNSGGHYGESYPSAGGGATDIALVTSTMSYVDKRTNRSAASLLSRLIVAGGGAGGSYRGTEEEVSFSVPKSIYPSSHSGTLGNTIDGISPVQPSPFPRSCSERVSLTKGCSYTISVNSGYQFWICDEINGEITGWHTTYYYTPASDRDIRVSCATLDTITDFYPDDSQLTISYEEITTSIDTSSSYSSQSMQGGGTFGLGVYPGAQTAAGNGGPFGLGATQEITNYRYAGGGGGGGWYGGGTGYSDANTSYIDYTGGGSGFVWSQKTKGNVPSGYAVPDSMLLTQEVTKDGAISFPSTSGGNEIGHSGNGYCKITVIE